jgi:hypothetical protein
MNTKILSIAQTDSGTQMICESDFCVSNGAAIKEMLLQSLQRSGDETLSLTHATSIDVSGVQLAFSWKKALLAQGRKAIVLLPQGESIKDLLEKTGITQIF